MNMYLTFLALSTAVFTVSLAEDRPEVTLSHGGKLRGLKSTFLDKPVDVYLGVRYAKAPVGSLRFKKPEELPGWDGVEEAAEVGQNCPQPGMGQLPGTPDVEIVGVEDCLFLDVTVPGGTKPGDKKAVMVFIHGGGYMIGSRSIYLGAPLATHGDIIMVTINYRLGVLGLLHDESGNGNFGLWDQRQALIWVKKNIASFGGDPDMVTIFGESAGGGSVSAQTMGAKNDGLFRRAITQSGSLYMMFDQSENTLKSIIEYFREKSQCSPDIESVYDCMSDLTGEQIINMTMMDGRLLIPRADNDFFPESVKEEIYDLSHRFDLMAGINGQEGGLLYAMELGTIAGMLNKTTDEGIDTEVVDAYLAFKCGQITPLSVELCSSFCMSEYELDKPTCPKERALYLTEMLGEVLFNADTLYQLEQHSSSDKSTYGYYFTENYQPQPPNPLWTVPGWLKKRADHGDELPFVFGAAFLKTGKAKMNDLWQRVFNSDSAFADMFAGEAKGDYLAVEQAYETLSTRMMTLWTNFAKSGNPNQPMAVDAPHWPQFSMEEGKFMELNLESPQAIDTPHRRRLQRIKTHIMSARRRQMNADKPSANDSGSKDQSASGGHDEL